MDQQLLVDVLSLLDQAKRKARGGLSIAADEVRRAYCSRRPGVDEKQVSEWLDGLFARAGGTTADQLLDALLQPAEDRTRPVKQQYGLSQFKSCQYPRSIDLFQSQVVDSRKGVEPWLLTEDILYHNGKRHDFLKVGYLGKQNSMLVLAKLGDRLLLLDRNCREKGALMPPPQCVQPSQYIIDFAVNQREGRVGLLLRGGKFVVQQYSPMARKTKYKSFMLKPGPSYSLVNYLETLRMWLLYDGAKLVIYNDLTEQEEMAIPLPQLQSVLFLFVMANLEKVVAVGPASLVLSAIRTGKCQLAYKFEETVHLALYSDAHCLLATSDYSGKLNFLSFDPGRIELTLQQSQRLASRALRGLQLVQGSNSMLVATEDSLLAFDLQSRRVYQRTSLHFSSPVRQLLCVPPWNAVAINNGKVCLLPFRKPAQPEEQITYFAAHGGHFYLGSGASISKHSLEDGRLVRVHKLAGPNNPISRVEQLGEDKMAVVLLDGTLLLLQHDRVSVLFQASSDQAALIREDLFVDCERREVRVCSAEGLAKGTLPLEAKEVRFLSLINKQFFVLQADNQFLIVGVQDCVLRHRLQAGFLAVFFHKWTRGLVLVGEDCIGLLVLDLNSKSQPATLTKLSYQLTVSASACCNDMLILGSTDGKATGFQISGTQLNLNFQIKVFKQPVTATGYIVGRSAAMTVVCSDKLMKILGADGDCLSTVRLGLPLPIHWSSKVTQSCTSTGQFKLSFGASKQRKQPSGVETISKYFSPFDIVPGPLGKEPEVPVLRRLNKEKEVQARPAIYSIKLRRGANNYEAQFNEWLKQMQQEELHRQSINSKFDELFLSKKKATATQARLPQIQQPKSLRSQQSNTLSGSSLFRSLLTSREPVTNLKQIVGGINEQLKRSKTSSRKISLA